MHTSQSTGAMSGLVAGRRRPWTLAAMTLVTLGHSVAAWTLPPHSSIRRVGALSQQLWDSRLHSSFFGKMDETEEEEDDDDDDDVVALDDDSVAQFRSRMTNLFEDSGGSRANSELLGYSDASASANVDWAVVASTVRPGCVLVAHPAAFLDDFDAKRRVAPALLSKFGLQQSPPVDLGPDRRADLLPVLLIVEQERGVTRAVLLNRRTGYLLGDLGQSSDASSSSSPLPLLEKFCIQPLWFGGVDSVPTSGSNTAASLDMLHQCPNVLNAVQITDDGLYWGGDPVQAQDAMDATSINADATVAPPPRRSYTGFDFKFFLQSTVYPAPQLQRALSDQTFFAVRVSKHVLFQSRDRMGSRRAQPLWTHIMELLGGDYLRLKHDLYGTTEEDESAYS